MIIIGITGPIGHGKTTVADSFASLEPTLCHFESSSIISEVGNAMHKVLQAIPNASDLASINNWIQNLPDILEQTVHIPASFDQLKLTEQGFKDYPIEYQKLILHIQNLKRSPDLAKQEITPQNKDHYRPFLQWLGGYLPERIDPGIWYKELVRRIHDSAQKGCEFCIVGGLRYTVDAELLRAEGAKIIKIYRPGYLQNDMLDPTERERENIQVDATILSTGTLDDLKRCTEVVWRDIKAGNLQAEYRTA